MLTEFKIQYFQEMLELKEDEIKDENLKNKIEDLKLIYSKFDNFIEDKFIDSDDDLTLLAKN